MNNSKKLSPAEEGNLAAKIEARANRMTREELLDYFQELCGPHLDPMIDARSTVELIASYVQAELERELNPDNGLQANLDKLYGEL